MGGEQPSLHDTRPITTLDISPRLTDALTRCGIGDIGHLRELTPKQLGRLPRIGAKSVTAVELALGRLGLRLADPEAVRIHPEIHRAISDRWKAAWETCKPGIPYHWDIKLDRGGNDRPALYRISNTSKACDDMDLLEAGMALMIRGGISKGYHSPPLRWFDASRWLQEAREEARKDAAAESLATVLRLVPEASTDEPRATEEEFDMVQLCNGRWVPRAEAEAAGGAS